MIKLDVSPSSIVVYCTVCSGWQQLAGSKAIGWAIADQHERNVHPADTGASSALAHWTRRHAAVTRCQKTV